jgi:hypothetical protein
MEFWIERYGSRRFGGKMVFFRMFWGYLWNVWVAGSSGAEEQGLLRSLGIFGGFL